MIKEVYNETGITGDFTEEFEVLAWRERPGAVQISWSNLAGSNDGTITVKVRLNSDHNWTTMSTIAMSAETDNAVFVSLNIFSKDVQIAYTANSITSIDMVISSAE